MAGLNVCYRSVCLLVFALFFFAVCCCFIGSRKFLFFFFSGSKLYEAILFQIPICCSISARTKST